MKNYSIKQTISLTEDSVEKRKDSYDISVPVDENTEQDIIIAQAAADLSINFGGVTNADVLIITTDLPLTAKINGGTTPIPIDSFLMLTGNDTTPLTQLELSNASIDTDANVRIVIGG